MALTAPDLKTSLPGPKAAAIVARDRARVSTSYTRDYPFVMARGKGPSSRTSTAIGSSTVPQASP